MEVTNEYKGRDYRQKHNDSAHDKLSKPLSVKLVVDTFTNESANT